MDKIEQYQDEMIIRKRALDTKRQVQCAENNKEEQMLMMFETILDKLKEGK